jgi:Zn-dependent peptidase ImmA (M78 family)
MAVSILLAASSCPDGRLFSCTKGVRSYTHGMNDILLPPMHRDQIKDCANSILKRYLAYGDAVERLTKLAKDNGVEVLEADMYDMSGALKRDRSGWKIYINRQDSPTRQIFTLAHELGHFFLHREEDEEFVDGDFVMNRDEDAKYRRKEMEANEFAGCIVMPEDMIRRRLGDRTPDDQTVVDLANQFHVSPLAMAIRLRSIGYEMAG